MGKLMSFLKKPHMLRLTLTRSVQKCLVALVFVLLWRYWINRALVLIRDGFFVAGVFFCVMAWFSYLGLDGVEGPVVYFRGRDKRKRPAHRRFGDMIDYVEEDADAVEELSDEERHLCGLSSNLFAALVFLIPAAIATVMTGR